MSAAPRRDAPIGHPSKSERDLALCKAFGRRLISAMDNNPNVPPPNYGRLDWLVDQLERRNITVTRQSVSRWTPGEVMPMPDRVDALAQILSVDAAWLMGGGDDFTTVRDRRAHNALASGAVNLVAGLIQMGGGTVAFAEHGDAAAVDIH